MPRSAIPALLMADEPKDAGLALLDEYINTLARELGRLDPDDPRRKQLLDELYRVSQIAQEITGEKKT